ncbi:MAG: hypothetical protein ABI647_26195 [Gemmatimonadota bacterium]
MAAASRTLKRLAILAILGTGLIHAMEAPPAFSEERYKGILFVANGIGALVAAIGIYRNQRLGWILGLLISLSTIIAYVASRTVGLPGLAAEPDAWLEPLGVLSLVCEAVFVIVFIAARGWSDKSAA